VLTGGLGADAFIFDMLLTRDIGGDDTITDYDIAQDHIELNGDVLVSLTDTIDGVLIEQISGASILVENVLAADIRPTIFGLVEI
jgi:Ca2+-binding RTX toxin-like protein